MWKSALAKGSDRTGLDTSREPKHVCISLATGVFPATQDDVDNNNGLLDGVVCRAEVLAEEKQLAVGYDKAL